MKKIFLTSACAMVVSACAMLADGQVQEVTIRTPGAENARCELNNGSNVYDAYSGQTILVKRNNSDIVVSCLASGNREKTVRGKWSANEWIWLNVANGVVPGMTYDILSQAAYEYPKDIKTGVYNTYAHCKQLFPNNPKNTYQKHIDNLEKDLAPWQIDIASKWLSLYNKGSKTQLLDEEAKVEVSFQKIYLCGNVRILWHETAREFCCPTTNWYPHTVR